MTTAIELQTALELSNGQVIKNRLLKSATSEQLGDEQHNPRVELANAYQQWAKGGVGLAISGNIMISRQALGEPRNVVLDEQSDFSGFRRWTKAATENGTQFWAQLNHPGKQSPSFLSAQPVAPSAVPLKAGLEKGFNTPRALSEDEIEDLIQTFAKAAKLAQQVGFTGVQIHAAHGYLISQFLSPRHNQRSDQWGGSSENRRRFLMSVYAAIREAVGNKFVVAVKLNSADFQVDGFTEHESMEVVQALDAAGIDLIEISGGTYEEPAMVQSEKKQSTMRREAFFLDFAAGLRQISKVPLAVTGGFRSAKGMQSALQDDATDMIGLARPMMLEPDLPNKAFADANYHIHLPNPTTGWKLLDMISMMNLIWYEAQILRLGTGLAPKPNLSAWMVALKGVMSMGRVAWQKRRA